MLLREVVDLLRAEVIWGSELLDILQIPACFAADLMSEVLAFSAPEALLITGLTNIQSVQTANVADLPAIVFVNDKRPGPQVLDLAQERGIPLLTTRFTMFAACGLLYENGLRPALKEK
jgi:predicted transcriptional regulator